MGKCTRKHLHAVFGDLVQFIPWTIYILPFDFKKGSKCPHMWKMYLKQLLLAKIFPPKECKSQKEEIVNFLHDQKKKSLFSSLPIRYKKRVEFVVNNAYEGNNIQ